MTGCLRAILLLAMTAGNAWACTESGRFSVPEESDSLYFHRDKHYTQGLRIRPARARRDRHRRVYLCLV